MGTYTFEIVLSDVTEITEKMEDCLFEAGCTDALLASCNGVVSLTFDRESRSRQEAVGTALADIIKAGYRPERVLDT